MNSETKFQNVQLIDLGRQYDELLASVQGIFADASEEQMNWKSEKKSGRFLKSWPMWWQRSSLTFRWSKKRSR